MVIINYQEDNVCAAVAFDGHTTVTERRYIINVVQGYINQMRVPEKKADDEYCAIACGHHEGVFFYAVGRADDPASRAEMKTALELWLEQVRIMKSLVG